MSAAREVPAPPSGQSVTCCRHGPADGGERTVYQLLRPRETDSALDYRIERPVKKGIDVTAVMHQTDAVCISERRGLKCKSGFDCEIFPQQTILRRRKLMTRRQRHLVVIAVPQTRQTSS